MPKGCLTCTFENNGRRKRCEMCRAVLPTDSSPRISQVEGSHSQKESRKRDRSAGSRDGVRSNAASTPQSQLAASSQDLSSASLTSLNRSLSDSARLPCPDGGAPSLFTTASGKSVSVGKEALARAKADLGAFDESRESNCKSLPSSGSDGPALASLFTTASGKAVNISKTSLQEAEAKFSEYNDERQCDAVVLPSFFTTAGGSSIKVSAKAVAEAKRKLASLDEDEAQSASERPLRQSPLGGEPRKFSVPRAQVDTVPLPCGNSASAAVPSIAVERRRTAIKTTQALLGTQDSDLTVALAGGGKSPSPAFQTPVRSFALPNSSAGADLVTPAPLAAKTSAMDSSTRCRRFIVPRSRQSEPDMDPARNGPQVGVTSVAPLRHISIDLAKFVVRCPLRSLLPVSDEVLTGAFRFSSDLCCPELCTLMNIASGTASNVKLEAKQFVTALIALGASPNGAKLEWVEQMLRSILWKLLSFERLRANDPLHSLLSDVTVTQDNVTVFSPVHALVQLCYRYNREFVDGHRSILRRIVEKDSAPTTLMVVVVSSILEERAGPHQVIVEITDGWYFVRASLDLPLSQIVRDGLLIVGQKILVWGAASTSDTACSPLELQGATATSLNLMFNGVRPAVPTAPLGALPQNTSMIVSIPSIHSSGGPVPCIAGIVTRVLPAYFIEKPTTVGDSSGNSHNRGMAFVPKFIRNSLAEARYAEEFDHKKSAAYEKAVLSMSSDDAAMLMRDQFTRDISECVTLIVESDDGDAVAVQRSASLRNGVGGGDEGCPREGQRIRLFNLFPSKLQQGLPPLNVKLLFARSQFLYLVDSHPKETIAIARGGSSSLKYSRASNIEFKLSNFEGKSLGQLVDAVVVSIGSRAIEKRNSCFIFCGAERNVFGILEAASIPGSREIALPSPNCATVCIIQNASFSCIDDSWEYTMVRLIANEFTVVLQRPASTALQQQVRALEGQQLLWKPTVDIGKKSLLGPDFTIKPLPNGKPGAGTEFRTFSVYEDGSAAKEYVGPYYLKHNDNTPIGSSGVKIVSPSPFAGTPHTTRPLFDGKALSITPSRPTSSNLRSDTTQQRRSSNLDTSPAPLLTSSSATDPSSLPSRHLFGNFITNDSAEKLALVVSCGRTFKAPSISFSSGFTSMPEVSMPPDDANSKLAVAITAPFRCGLHDVLDVTIPETLFNTLFDQLLSISPHQLSALATDDDFYVFAAKRAAVISSFGPETAWSDFFLRSVVLTRHQTESLFDEMKNSGVADDLLSDEILSSFISTKTVRWNGKLHQFCHLSEAMLLLWTEGEWRTLVETLASIFDGKLFKLTVSSDVTVEKIFFLKERCLVEELYA